MEAIKLDAQVRLEKNKFHKHSLRKRGFIPAVIYGKTMSSMPIAVNTNELQKILGEAGSNALINMSIKRDGATEDHQVLVKSVQRDVLHNTLIHADFHQVSLKDMVNATVPVHLTGSAPGVSKGGILAQPLRGVEVECLASSIPEAFTVDISSLDIGQEITLADLVLPPGVKVIGEGHAHVVAIYASHAVEDAEPAKEEAVEEVKE
ncbi:MAG: 50S ribosomal protein L25 [Desulfotomaculaceae bacterium]|nr:50S ribosomal protein L25 [Desulfotomaculaceae bacterium]